MPTRTVRFLVASVVSALAIAVIPASAALADHGSGDSTSNASTSSTSSGNEVETHNTSPTSSDTKSSTETHNTLSSDKGKSSSSEGAAETETSDSASGSGETHRFEGNSLKTCQNRQVEITGIMARSVTRAQNQIDLFATIATRTETFYTNQGKTLSNYDALVAAVASAKTQAQTDLQTLKGLSFSCDSTNPKGQVAAFKAALATERNDLEVYRTAVKNLIAGVKSVQEVQQ